MNPFIKNALISVVRNLVVPIVAWLVARGLLPEDQAVALSSALAILVINAASSVRDKFKDRQEKLVGLTLPPGSTENDAKAAVKAGLAPSVTTQHDEVPVLNVAAMKSADR